MANELEFKGTKGEWGVLEVDDIFITTKEKQICMIKDNGLYLPWNESRDNAKLIASAPELLKALQEILKWSAHFPEAMNEDLIEANEAIEKALK